VNNVPLHTHTHTLTLTLKISLDKFWCYPDITYDFRAVIQGTESRSKESVHNILVKIFKTVMVFLSQFGTLIWPGIVTYWKRHSGDQRGLSKGITGRHPV